LSNGSIDKLMNSRSVLDNTGSLSWCLS